MSKDESDEGWRFSVDEFDDAPEESPASSTTGPSAPGTTDDGDERDANVAGEFSPAVPVVPEMPELENAAFVTLGAIVTVLAFAAIAGGETFGLLDAVTVAAVVGALGAVLYGAFVRFTPDT